MVGIFTFVLLGVSGFGELVREDLCRKAVVFFMKLLVMLFVLLGREACFCIGGFLRGYLFSELLDTGLFASILMEEVVCVRRTVSFISGLWGVSFRYISGGVEYRRLCGEVRVYSFWVLIIENRFTVLVGELLFCCIGYFRGDFEVRVLCVWGWLVWSFFVIVFK